MIYDRSDSLHNDSDHRLNDFENLNKDGYIENTPEVEVEAASSSCCWRLWGSRVVEVFFLIAIWRNC